MTFDLLAILVFGLFAVFYAWLLPPKWRAWVLLIGSIIAVYWLQPPLPIRFSDFILPTLTILLTVLTWTFTRLPGDDNQTASWSEDRKTILVIVALVVGLAFMRYVDQDFRITASRPPPPILIFLSLVLIGGLIAITSRLLERRRGEQSHLGNRVLTAIIVLIVVLFAIFKTEFLATAVSGWWRGLTGQDQALAAMVDLRWVGFSFVAFRLIHTLRDRQQGILPVMSLREFVSFALFFPAYTAGPIDRAERFVPDFRALPDQVGLNASRWARGLRRIFTGLFKKFVIADTLAQGMALTAENAVQTESTLALWLLLYGYALRLYFDFAGYSDIAIGIGILLGIELPENFDRPYLKSNITAFWQSWHMTLSNWVRFYVFTPLSRWLLRRTWRPSSTIIVLTAQVATMIVMGLWHGVTWNFFIWGLWHGLGLFAHKQWSDRTRKWYRDLSRRPGRKRTWTTLTWFVTLNYVVLGWVWFALPSVEASLNVMAGLFGLNG